jgi:hypothetical protein
MPATSIRVRPGTSAGDLDAGDDAPPYDRGRQEAAAIVRSFAAGRSPRHLGG